MRSFNCFFITSLLSSMCAPISIMTTLNYNKGFRWFYYADAKDLVLVWFRFLVCKNSFQLLIVPVIMETCLIVCLKLLFLIVFLLLRLLHHLLEVEWVVYQLILLVMYQLVLPFYYLFCTNHFNHNY